MFLGEYHYVMDQKGRLAVPPKFRDSFRAGLVVTRGFDKCILVYALPEWKTMADRMASLPATRSSVRRANRHTFSGAYNLDLDKQGRILIPQTLREYGGIISDVVVAGVHNYLEIWAKELWDDETAVMRESGWQIGESIEYPE